MLVSYVSFPIIFPEKSFYGVWTFWVRTLVFECGRRVLTTAPAMTAKVLARGKADTVKRAFYFPTFVWANVGALVLAGLCD